MSLDHFTRNAWLTQTERRAAARQRHMLRWIILYAAVGWWGCVIGLVWWLTR